MNNSQLLALEALVVRDAVDHPVRGVLGLRNLVRLRVAQASEQHEFASHQLAKVRQAGDRDAEDARSLPLNAVVKSNFRRADA